MLVLNTALPAPPRLGPPRLAARRFPPAVATQAEANPVLEMSHWFSLMSVSFTLDTVWIFLNTFLHSWILLKMRCPAAEQHPGPCNCYPTKSLFQE